jgi:putative transcriptional regulator
MMPKAKTVSRNGVLTFPMRPKPFLIQIDSSGETNATATVKIDFSDWDVSTHASMSWSTPHAHKPRASFLLEKPTPERSSNMTTTRLKIEPGKIADGRIGRINVTQVDATTDAQIAIQMAQDDTLAIQDAAKFARRVRRRLGFSQAEFATRIDVSLETIRNWEQGKRSPTGAAKALLKVLDKAPEAALAALH